MTEELKENCNVLITSPLNEGGRDKKEREKFAEDFKKLGGWF